MSDLVAVGRLTTAYGIKGWVKVQSHTEPTTNIFSYRPWHLTMHRGTRQVDLVQWRAQGKGFVAQIGGVDNRDQAESLCPVTIMVARQLLPALPVDEYYWHQLENCRVVSCFAGSDIDLGVVKHLQRTGANDVLVVVGDGASIDERERWIPFVMDRFVTQVDLVAQVITVDWDAEF